MSLDLTLIPVEHDDGRWGYGHTVLRMDAANYIHDLIERFNLRETDPPDKFNTYLSRDDKYEEPHYGETNEDPYGEPLRCVRAGDLGALVLHENVTARDRAVWAYIRQLPPETKIALYWH